MACKLQLVTFKFHPETLKLHLVISEQQLLTRKLQLVSDGSDRRREREKISLIKLTVSKRKIVTKRKERSFAYEKVAVKYPYCLTDESRRREKEKETLNRFKYK